MTPQFEVIYSYIRHNTYFFLWALPLPAYYSAIFLLLLSWTNVQNRSRRWLMWVNKQCQVNCVIGMVYTCSLSRCKGYLWCTRKGNLVRRNSHLKQVINEKLCCTETSSGDFDRPIDGSLLCYLLTHLFEEMAFQRANVGILVLFPKENWVYSILCSNFLIIWG